MSDRYDEFRPVLEVRAEGAVRIVTLNRPEKLNAFDDDLHRAVWRVWDALLADEDARAVVLTGSGRAFSSGGQREDFIRDYRTYDARRKGVRTGERLVRAMVDFDLPVVAAVNGPAIGLGCTVAVLSDIVLMAEDAFMADPHVSVGLVAGDGGAMVWPLLMSLLKAKEYLLLGDPIPTSECERLGLANRVVPKDDLMGEALSCAERLASQPRQAMRDTKRAVNLFLRQATDLVLPFSLAAEMESFGTEDAKRRAEAFLAKSSD